MAESARIMTNVIPLRPRRPAPEPDVVTAAPWDRTALVGALACMIEQVEIAGAQVAVLDRPALQVERIIQFLMDATTSLECAVDALVDGYEREG